MTQEQKDLLLKDLSARLPYGVKLGFYTEAMKETYTCTLLGLEPENDKPVIAKTDHGSFCVLADHVKPYLFPLSSMTEEQKKEFFNGTPLEIDKYGDVAVKDDSFGNSQYTDLEIYLDVIDRLLKNHFDIRGLIPMGLANDATGLNIY